MGKYDRKIFGFNLKKLRNNMKMSQTELANKMGVSQNTVSNWESGNREPDSIEQFLQLCDVFNVTLDELVEEHSQFGNHDANLKYLEDKPELQSIYTELVNRDEIYILFDKTKDLDPKDVESVLMFVQTIRKQRGMDE